MLAAGSALQQVRRNKNKYDPNLGTRSATPSSAPTIGSELMLSYTAEYIIQNWRLFVRERIEVIYNHLALEAITRASQNLKLVWQRADSGNFDETTEHPGSLLMVHWMEVMMKEQLAVLDSFSKRKRCSLIDTLFIRWKLPFITRQPSMHPWLLLGAL